MDKNTMFGATMLALVAIAPAWSADVKVNWQDTAKYTDINAGEEDQDKFNKELFRDFDAIFTKLGGKMPDSLHWEVTVTDLDLAGEVRQPPVAGGRLMRTVRSTDRPAISFSYRLVGQDGTVLKEDKVDLKDPTFMSRSPAMIGLRVKPHPYEEYMINRWFEEQQGAGSLPGR